ncbi:terpenoid cyclases/protein prenyltransferase alpha-alpha toroid [Aspergillus alliaceus]|uniref:Terpenoid cyclases/protein prenyltransferase alpha-alpha toroid n=1 Tax=Petromyces alliaceus TaxID=209559 RepID=A0A5N7BVW0_PETAA|nr:terpenoid cyclases/protein prenyltransferase alpha-alpha toroid [Aspergillus alliaceus]
MGVPADEEHLRKARSYYLRSGGAVYLPCWAKFWLALLGLYDWEGIDPYPVEMWLLPEWFPVSPWQWSTLLSKDLLDEIRAVLFPESFSSVNFVAFEGVILPSKQHQAKSWMLRTLNWAL